MAVSPENWRARIPLPLPYARKILKTQGAKDESPCKILSHKGLSAKYSKIRTYAFEITLEREICVR
jgi:hypothetical protein